MKIRVERNELTDAVAWTARSLPARPTVPVLAGLLMEADAADGGEGLTLSGFDFEVGARAQLDVTVAEPGRVLVSGRLLAEITRSLPAAPVDLEVDGSRLVVRCGNARFALPTLPVEDYPDLPAMPPVAGRVAAAELASAVSQVVVAAGRDDTLPMLTGVRMEIEGERVTLVATDRYRLAVRELRWRPEDPEVELAALVPARTLSEAAKTLTTGGAEVTIALGSGAGGESMAGFENGARRTTTRLLDGEFVKYRSLLPSSAEAVAELPTAALVEAVRRVALVAQRTAPVRLSFSEGALLLEAGSGEDAQASEQLEADYRGEPLTIAFNPGYLLDGLNALDSDTARLEFTAPTKPAVVTGKQGDDAAGEQYRYLLMPVRLSG